jgi:hypothetical protein
MALDVVREEMGNVSEEEFPHGRGASFGSGRSPHSHRISDWRQFADHT